MYKNQASVYNEYQALPHSPCLQMSAVNQVWLCDLALRLMSVIALDRFGDFVSDEVGLNHIGKVLHFNQIE